jgi:hypothetical protein
VAAQFKVERLGHANHVASSYDASKDAYERIFGGYFFREWGQPEHGTKNALITVSDTCLELFGVTDPEQPLGRWATRQGGGAWHSIEWTIPSQDEGDDILREHNIRITDRTPGGYTFTHPRDCHGICLELTEAHFADDPREDPSREGQPAFWADEHPLGITGLACIRVTAKDAMESADWLTGITGVDVGYDRPRAVVGGRGVGVPLPGHTIEFIEPAGDGAIQQLVAERGERIHSLSYTVKDLDAAREHLRSIGVATEPGTVERSLHIDPAVTQGALFELTTE